VEKRGLNLDVITRAAVQLLDEVGLAELSTRRLAAKLEAFQDCAGAGCRQRTEDPRLPCLRGPLRASAGGIGPLRLGADGAELLSAAGSPERAGKRRWRWCDRDGGWAKATFAKSGAVRQVATTAATTGTRGVHPGSRAAKVWRAYPGAERVSRRRITAADGRVIFVVREGRVRLVIAAG